MSIKNNSNFLYVSKKHKEPDLYCGYEKSTLAVLNSDFWGKEEDKKIPNNIEENQDYFKKFIHKITLTNEEYKNFEYLNIYEKSNLIKEKINKLISQTIINKLRNKFQNFNYSENAA